MVAAAKSGAKVRERRRMLQESAQLDSSGTASGSAASGSASGSVSAATAAGAAAVVDKRIVMVSDSSNSSAMQPLPPSAPSASSIGQQQGEEEYEGDDFDDDAATELSDLPLSFGERLILETCMRYRSRPYDRQRQEFLSKPKRRGCSIGAWRVEDDEIASGSGSTGPRLRTAPSGAASEESGKIQDRALSGEETKSLISRLSQPKRVCLSKKPPGEEIIMRSRAKEQDKIDSGVDVKEVVNRLSTPRAARVTSPTPGERMVMLYNKCYTRRAYDPVRISDLAKASRRGGSARAWGVRSSSVPSSAAADPAPQSAREPRGGGTMPMRARPGAEMGTSSATEDSAPPSRGLDLGEQSDGLGMEDETPLGDSTPAVLEEALLPGIDTPDRGSSGSPKDASWAHPWRSSVDRFS